MWISGLALSLSKNRDLTDEGLCTIWDRLPAHCKLKLHLRQCGLKTFPHRILDMTDTTEIDLSDNDMDQLPWGLLRLTHLTKFNIHENRRLETLNTILGNDSWEERTHKNDIQALFAYLRDLYGGGDEPAWRYDYKLVIVGPTMSGKTSLLDAMRRGADRKLADADSERTIGLDIKELVLHDGRARDGGVARGKAYDAGGHDEYREMLQAFFSVGALYLLLFDVSKLTGGLVLQLRQWVTSI